MVLLDDILWKCNTVMARCVVDKANMLANIESQNGLVMAKVMLALVDEGCRMRPMRPWGPHL